MTTVREEINKFLILIDFSEDAYKALDDLIKLVKTVGGEIEIFSVINPFGIADNDNQITALRAIQTEENRVMRKLNSIVEMITLEGIRAKCEYSIGNVKSELKLKLAKTMPDVMVLSKRGHHVNGILQYLINEYKATVLILGNSGKFLEGDKITVGYEDKLFNYPDFQLVYKISRAIQIKMTLLRSINSEDIDSSMGISDKALKNIPSDAYSSINYQSSSDVTGTLLKNSLSSDVAFLCIGKVQTRKSLFRNPFKNSITFTIAKNTRVPLLIMGMKNESFMV